MDVIVLAGGFGTRLRPWTLHAPKPLIPILDRTMIEHVVSIFPEGTVDKVLIAAGYGIEQMRNHFAALDLPYEVVIVEETEPLGTGGAIANCREHLGEGTCCVINGDLLTSLRVDEMLRAHKAAGTLASISLWEVEDPSRFGVADYDSQSTRIRRFQEKPPREEAYSNLINAGTYLLEPEVFDRMPEGAFSMERIVFPVLAEDGELSGFPFEGHFVDAGTPESYIEAVQTSIQNEAWIRGESADGGNWFGENVHLESMAQVSGSAIDSNCNIGASCSIVSSSLLNSVTVDSGSKVTGCMIGHNAQIGEGCNLQNVVVDHGAIVPSGHVQNGGVFPTAD
ncbi:MAG TPA: NDP-sugar synthase [Candidatus Thalassarchaeaceae archaeon]|nr:NDP-sugar synthase [Candidatus Thalassarchaeaceae archaeon]